MKIPSQSVKRFICTLIFLCFAGFSFLPAAHAEFLPGRNDREEPTACHADNGTQSDSGTGLASDEFHGDAVGRTAGDPVILLVWLAFPPAAFVLAWSYSRRFRPKPKEAAPPAADEMLTFVPSTYAYYPVRKDHPAPPLPQPARTTRKKDRLLATLALVCGSCGLLVPLVGFCFGLGAVLLAGPVVKRNNHFCRRAEAGWVLGLCCLVQTALYFAASALLG